MEFGLGFQEGQDVDRGEEEVVVEESGGLKEGMAIGQHEVCYWQTLHDLKHSPCSGIKEDTGGRQAEAASRRSLSAWQRLIEWPKDCEHVSRTVI